MLMSRADDIIRARALTDLEALRLYKAVNHPRIGTRKTEQWRWSRADILRLRRHLLNGRKPAAIAILMKRSERAIWRVMNRLGWTVRDAELWVVNPGSLNWVAADNYRRKDRRRRTVQSRDDDGSGRK